MPASFAARRDRLRRLLKKQSVEWFLITQPTNVSYLTGFTGDDSYLLLGQREAVVLSDARFATQLEQECPGLDCEIRQPPTTMIQLVETVLKRTKAARLGIEGAAMTVALYEVIARSLPQLELQITAGLVESLRIVKDASEISAIRRAVRQAERGFQLLRAGLRPEQTERQIAAQLEYHLRLEGAKGASFETIIAAGPHSALPHARPRLETIGDADLLLVDWGANEGQYVSDLTRVLVTGKPTQKLKKVYTTVWRAQRAAIERIRPGITCQEVDAAARDVISEAGFGRNFGHGLGHGIGLMVHESPRLAPQQTQPLKPGMVITVEPGIYLPGWGGVRLEDDVLVTKSGHEVLSTLPLDWESALAPW